jgi:hypothetical protein
MSDELVMVSSKLSWPIRRCYSGNSVNRLSRIDNLG